MKSFPFGWLAVGVVAVVAASSVRADQIEMQNGDRYNGKLVAMTNATLVLQSEILGTVTLPREKVSQIRMGNGAATTAVSGAKAESAKPVVPQQRQQQQRGQAGIPNLGAITNSASGQEDQKKLTQQVQD